MKHKNTSTFILITKKHWCFFLSPKNVVTGNERIVNKSLKLHIKLSCSQRFLHIFVRLVNLLQTCCCWWRHCCWCRYYLKQALPQRAYFYTRKTTLQAYNKICHNICCIHVAIILSFIAQIKLINYGLIGTNYVLWIIVVNMLLLWTSLLLLPLLMQASLAAV